MSDETNRIELIKVSKEFKGIMGGLWLGMESEVLVSSDDDVLNEFKKRNELLEKAYMALNPQIKWSENGSIINKEVERIEIAIDNSQTLEELNTYMNDSMKYGLVEHFINKKKSFQP